MPDDLRQHFSVDGEQSFDDSPFGKSPSLSPRFIPRTTGFALPERPSLASSGDYYLKRMNKQIGTRRLVIKV